MKKTTNGNKNAKPFLRGNAQGIVEFALVLPVLLMVLYGVLETGRLLFIYGSTVTAARQAVRYGSATGVGPNGEYYDDCTGIRAAAQKVGFINTFNTIDISYDGGVDAGGTPQSINGAFPTCPVGAGNLTNGDRIVVQVTTQWVPIVPIVPLKPFTIRSKSERTILVSVDLLQDPDPSIFAGTASACAKLLSISASPEPYSGYASGSVTLTYHLHKYGEVDLVPNVIDPNVGGISCSPNPVTGDTDFTCTGAHTVTQQDIDNGSFANTAYPTSYCPTKAMNTITKTTTITQNPALDLTKTPSIDATSSIGTVITYTYRMTNSGNVTLSPPFSVTDDRIATVTCPQPATLSVGAYIDCTSLHTLTASDISDRQIVNVAQAHAVFNSTAVDSNSASATVYTPPIYLVVVPSALKAIAPNQVITYTYNIKNITDFPIYSPSVTDDTLSVNCSAASNPIPVSATTQCTATYTVTQAAMDAGTVFTHKATAYGIRDSVTVSSNTYTTNTPFTQTTGISAALNATPNSSPVVAGSTITYVYTLTNSGNVSLTTPITVIDNKTPIICADQSAVAPGTTRSCSGTYTVTAADMAAGSVTNTGSASATFGASVTSSPVSATVITFTGARFSLAVSPDKTVTTYNGEQITYTYTFTNTGAATLSLPFAVTSSLGSVSPASTLDCSLAASSIVPGTSTTCKSTYTVSSAVVTSAGTITNTVTDATAMNGAISVHASNVPVAATSTTAYYCTSTNLKYTVNPTSGGSGNKIVTWTVSNTVGTPLPISAVIISWAGSGNGNSDFHLNGVAVTNSTLTLGPLPENFSSYISGTGTLNTGSSNLTMTFSKNNPTGISVQIVFASPYGTCHLP